MPPHTAETRTDCNGQACHSALTLPHCDRADRQQTATVLLSNADISSDLHSQQPAWLCLEAQAVTNTTNWDTLHARPVHDNTVAWRCGESPLGRQAAKAAGHWPIKQTVDAANVAALHEGRHQQS